MTSSVSLVFLRPWSVRVWGDQITGLKDSSQPKLQVIGRFLGLCPEGNQTKKPALFSDILQGSQCRPK